MMSRRRSRRWAAVAGVVGGIVLAVFVYLWLDMRKANETPAPPDEATQTPVVEPPEPEELKPPQVSNDNGQAEAAQVESPQTPPRAAPEETIGEPNGNLDPVDEAWAVVNHIKANLHEWGDFSPEAKIIMDTLMPVWEIDEASAEESIALLMQLYEYRDPRSAEVLAAYIFEAGGFTPSYFKQMINLGPPSIPYIMPYFKKPYPDNDYAAEIFIGIWQTNRDLLDGVAKHIVIPELERSLKVNNMRTVRAYLNQLKSALE